MGLFGGNNTEQFKSQNYSKLRKNCMKTKDIFEDALFPANENSLNLSKTLYGKVVWKRPPEICERPKLFVEKAEAKDVTQGNLGNCWFVAACSALATVKPLWSNVIPDYKLQEWDPVKPEEYAGIFHFRFWRFGKWIDVVVDDRLPTINGELIFCHSTTDNEFWSALLEKAYAKLCGSYGAMDGGNLSDALVDFTSGLCEMIMLKQVGYAADEDKKNELRKQMLREYEDHALMCCAITTSDSSLMESRTKTGLVLGHAYGITAVREISVGSSSGLLSLFKTTEKITLLRLRNPWGQKEWNGAFSDGSSINTAKPSPDRPASVIVKSAKGQSPTASASTITPTPGNASASISGHSGSNNFAYTSEHLLQLHSRSVEWTKISKSEKEKLGLTFEDDGEFWMPFDDFITEFTDLSICHLINTSLFTFKKRWTEHCFKGEWTTPHNAGGCANHDSFLNNPQYCFDVPKNDMEIVVHLLQSDQRGRCESDPTSPNRTSYQSIGFEIMKTEDNRQHRTHRRGKKVATSDYVKGRSVYFDGTLNKGRYLLVPTTFEPNVETEYYLRVYTEDDIVLRQLKTDYPEPPLLCRCCCAPPMCVTVMTVQGATGLALADNLYCIAKVEGQKLRSSVIHSTQSPEWNLEGVFFRKDVCKPIFVEVWQHRVLWRDTFLGAAVITESADGQKKSISSPLVGRGLKRAERHPGELNVEVVTYNDLLQS